MKTRATVKYVLFAAALLCGFSAFLVSRPGRPLNPSSNQPGVRPVYPLYSPYFGGSHQFTEQDLEVMSQTFDFVYGGPLTREEMATARHHNPQIRFIRYIGSWTVQATEAEKGLHKSLLTYRSAVLAEDLPAGKNLVGLKAVPELKALTFKESTSKGSLSTNVRDYVSWIRVGNELMKVERFWPDRSEIQVVRGFAESENQTHRKGEPVLSPLYGVAPGSEGSWDSDKGITYHYDPASKARWDHVFSFLVDFIEAGGDGIWIDILMDKSLRGRDINGEELGILRSDNRGKFLFDWNLEKGRPYYTDEFREKNEAGVTYIQKRFEEVYKRPPLIYGNNLMASRFEEGSGGHKFYLLPTSVKPHPVQGMCIEDFMGGYEHDEWMEWYEHRKVSSPEKACYNCTNGYKNWEENVKLLMKCAQENLAAMPLIINAGMKTAIFEALPLETRHEWELWAYASYLLGVEKKQGSCPTKLGVPMFYRRGEQRRVGIDPIYFWDIGAPSETVPPEEFGRYKVPGTDLYRRNFQKGVVFVNPSEKAARLQLDRSYVDPETGVRTETLKMAGQSGKILLSE